MSHPVSAEGVLRALASARDEYGDLDPDGVRWLDLAARLVITVAVPVACPILRRQLEDVYRNACKGERG